MILAVYNLNIGLLYYGGLIALPPQDWQEPIIPESRKASEREAIVKTVNGEIKARAWLHRGIRATSMFISIGWDKQQPFHPISSVNHLTGIQLDPVSQQAN